MHIQYSRGQSSKQASTDNKYIEISFHVFILNFRDLHMRVLRSQVNEIHTAHS